MYLSEMEIINLARIHRYPLYYFFRSLFHIHSLVPVALAENLTPDGFIAWLDQHQYEDRQPPLTDSEWAAIVEALGGRQRDEDKHPEIIMSPYVQLMTIHAAKGLEFPVVIIPEVQANLVRDNENRQPDFVVQNDLKANDIFGLDITPQLSGIEQVQKSFTRRVQMGQRDRLLLQVWNLAVCTFGQTGNHKQRRN